MAHFDSSTLQHLKKLCRLDCSPEEEEEVLHSLQRILDYVEQLEGVETEGVQPCNYVLRSMVKNRFREDVTGEVLLRDQFLSNAPDQIGGMIRVPPVMKSS